MSAGPETPTPAQYVLHLYLNVGPLSNRKGRGKPRPSLVMTMNGYVSRTPSVSYQIVSACAGVWSVSYRRITSLRLAEHEQAN